MIESISIPTEVQKVLDCLEQAGYAAYVVGGAVRDQLAGKKPHDFDVCTAARPKEIQAICSQWKTVETGLKHGTVTVIVGDRPIEVTTFRTEGKYSDCRRPDRVQFVDAIEHDLARRDFTINAMAWSPKRGFCDPFHGRQDLCAGILRCVRQPEERLKEDALRILRALRFAAENGYRMEMRTEQAVHNCRSLLRYVSAERITEELLRILCGSHVGPVLIQYSDVITEILPELRPMIGFSQNNPHHKYDLWEHSVRAVEGIRPEPLLRLVMLLHDVGKTACYTEDESGRGHFYGHAKLSVPLSRSVMCHLRLERTMHEDVLYLVRHHDTPLGLTPLSVRRKLAVHGERHYRHLLAIHKADCIGQGTTEYNLNDLLKSEQLFETVLMEEGRLKRRDLAVDGNDLLAWGVHGMEIGEMLAALLNYVMDDPSRNTREQLHKKFLELRQHEDRAEFTVNGMSWGHCADEVRAALEHISSIREAIVDLPSGRVEVVGDHISLGEIRQVLADAGYEVAI